MTRRWSAVVAASVVAVAALSGCTGSDEPDDPIGNSTPAPRGPIAKGAHYVALGDSHVSGPELGPSVGPAGCFRTTANFPHLLAEKMDLELVDASCGGATTDDITQQQRVQGGGANDPQIDSVTADTDLVTISIGGNNDGLLGNLIVTCARAAGGNFEGSPCADADRKNGRLPEHAERLQRQIVLVLDEIRERAPRARVVVIGYPQWFPAKGWCIALPLAKGDYAFGRAVVELTNTTMRKAAEQAGVEFVSVWEASEGHDVCADDPWIAGANPVGKAAPYHPYAVEPQYIAKTLAQLLKS